MMIPPSARHKIRFSKAIFIALIVAFVCQSAYGKSAILADELQERVKYLASANMAGRHWATEDANRAAAYITGEFRRYGLKPFGDAGTYYQVFSHRAGYKVEKRSSFSIALSNNKTIDLEPQIDYVAVDGAPSSSKATGKVVFVGYGIVMPSKKWDDYKGIDVKGKIVAVLRGAPDILGSVGDEQHLFTKTANAFKNGAAGVIFITPEGSPLVELPACNQIAKVTHIPQVIISKKTAEIILEAVGQTLRQLTELSGSRGNHFIDLQSIAYLEIEVIQNNDVGKNVVAVLPSKFNSKQIIVVGAHYDHIGFEASAEKPTKIYHGADDNASGVSAMLEIAEYAASLRNFNHTIVFIAFSCEEYGLVGSKHYVQRTGASPQTVKAMINLDMLGRLRNNQIWLSTENWTDALQDQLFSVNISDFVFKEGIKAVMISDQVSFGKKGIPSILFNTGIHEEYHTPEDTWDKLNYNGMEQIASFVFRFIKAID